ncbi:HNH endonuclease signature motif containing protein [Roseibium sp. FZY0029]|uniref:HNH endonuclease n=1 Tax=Roseibium sp. FZY0029 TaxID=3116647 RepID=UPI002EA53BC6|nr:HNH endonuclease signature motif containing protein [Roseibium sp. FZY0029]
MMKPTDDHGRELDALFSVERWSEGFDLIVESRGGSDHGPNAARNSDYAPAMELHLSRMGALGMVLEEVQVASSIAMKLPESGRRVSLDRFMFPVNLSRLSEFTELRHSIGRASAAYGRVDGSDRGNRTKRMLLRMSWPRDNGSDARGIEILLAFPREYLSVEEAPTAQPRELDVRVESAVKRIRAKAETGIVDPPPGQTMAGSISVNVTRFVRDPNVIAWVLNEAGGRCEICETIAPFLRSNGEPYFEVHHVRPLGEGGPDTIDNAVACCPNCHRKLHYSAEKDSLRVGVISKIRRLIDYPKVKAHSPKTGNGFEM